MCVKKIVILHDVLAHGEIHSRYATTKAEMEQYFFMNKFPAIRVEQSQSHETTGTIFSVEAWEEFTNARS